MRKESATIRRCHSQLSALGLDSDAVFHRSKLILKIYRDVVWVLSERVEELQEYAWDLGKQDIDTGLCYLENFAPDIDLQDFEEKVCCVVESRMFVEIIDRALLRLRKYPDRGELYYEILTKQFIYRFNSTEKEMLALPSSPPHRTRRKSRSRNWTRIPRLRFWIKTERSSQRKKKSRSPCFARSRSLM